MKKFLLLILIFTSGLLLLLFINREIVVKKVFAPTPVTGESGVSVTSPEVVAADVAVVAENLEIPWDLVFLPNGEILVSERSGFLVKLSDQSRIAITGTKHQGEGGLLGLALHPNFSNNNFLYLYLTATVNGGLLNRVERYIWQADTLNFDKIIIDNIPGASYHDGGQLEFGPDGFLYIATGDAGDSNLAQNVNSLAGKILRLHDDGSIPVDNPWGTAVYSYGHRNVQGLAWDGQGRLWATEHGRSGVRSGFDELNLIAPGKNYGWPEIEGDAVKNNMETPVINSGATATWAPAGLAYLDGSLFFGGLRGNALYQFDISSGQLTSHFYQEFGRIRAVVKGPDGFLYISTSNRDGRGEVQAGDDKIIKINPKIFQNL